MRNGEGTKFTKTRQNQNRSGRGAPVDRGKGRQLDSRNQEQRTGRHHPMTSAASSWTLEHIRPPIPVPLPGKRPCLELITLKDKAASEVVQKLNDRMEQLKFLLLSQEDQHNSDEFIFDLICTLAVACSAAPGEKTNKILAALKGSVFLTTKIPNLLDRVHASVAMNDKDSRRKLIECLITVFTKYLTHLPSSYADPPYEKLKQVLDQSNMHTDRKEQLQKELDAFKRTRDDIVRRERQGGRKGGRKGRVGEKPPNDFRDIPICPTNKEITTQERPFLRKNITKGRYENAEHYLDVQFRLLREDFLEPLREGIHEIVQNIPRPQRKQLTRNYRNVQIVSMKSTWSGIIYQVQIDISRLDTSRWAQSKRLIYGSLLCLSQDNFNTMLFATVAERNPDELEQGRIEIRFIEEQDVLGIERRNCVYQMVESPAYFEAYRYVLKGLKELDETTLPFKKYLVECCEEVNPPEYLRRDDTQEPVCYDLSKALQVQGVSKANAVPVLNFRAWPPVKALPLNVSQFDALRTAITTEFSVIQGPPGTGKTYVGAKIVRCLLANRKAWDPERNSPMLMVCYTNHALDQFLEKVLEFLPSRNIIRVGGRSKSVKLEDCNLKKFTYRSRSHAERDKVNEKMIQNDSDMKTWKKHLAKADQQLLMFEDLEELMTSAHADQLCNAVFPSNVANESRTPDNTFKLWLCQNTLVGSLNQSTPTKTEDRSKLSPDGSMLKETGANENNEVSYQATLARTTDGDENIPNKPQIPEQNHRVNTSRASVNEGSTIDSTPLKKVGLTVVPDGVTGPESLHTENEPREAQDETITIEREADLIQNQRSIQGEEERLSVISEIKTDFVTWEQEDALSREEEHEGWITVTYKTNGNPFFWQEKDEQNCTQENKSAQMLGFEKEDHGNKTKLRKEKKKKRKKQKKKKNSKIEITADISTLQVALTNQEMMTTDEAMVVDNIWNLSQADRLRLYLFWIENYRERYRVEIHRSEQKYKQLCEELDAVTFEEEEKVIRRATVVGMTTTGAAKYHAMLQRVAPKIVVIEEAAEVMESHIITSLSHSTKHTILIGDHKQLRPKATVYKLAQKYNLEVSLFERMVMNNMECKRLSIQHRMRPEIAALTKRIYDHEIDDHESVCHFDDICGVSHNLFFINHSQPETLVEGLQSYSNHHEAEFLVGLCNYLLLQGYQRSQIIVLTMYTGQLRNFEGVRVCAVDNFQGEENDIILLSLVRSNSEGCIGFLGESNRICVALSRARQGFYCIGNFTLLSSQSRLWKEICDDLRSKEAIGDSLQLVCKRHNNVTTIRLPREFRILSWCKMRCGDRLDCGHACEIPCHALEFSHGPRFCSKMCSRSCPNNHKCPLPCHYPFVCPGCPAIVLKTLPWCGHEIPVMCCIDPAQIVCELKCKKILKCGHNCQELCCSPCTKYCIVPCDKTLPCGHKDTIPCHKDPMVHRHCNKKCTKVLNCGHPCSNKCTEPCQCAVEIEIQLACEHIKRTLCHEKHFPLRCNEKCKRVLDCGHNCTRICREDCRVGQCKVEVVKVLPCGHQRRIPCFQDPKTVFCSEPCPRQLDCGHKCSSMCGCPCQEVQCKELCQLKCVRGHSCQRRCHFGSLCDDCMIEVSATIPECGHSITMPCFFDPATLKCKHECDRIRDCGHPCKDICSENCNDRLCKTRVPRTLPCAHVVTLECYKKPEKFICENVVKLHLLSGHKITLKCYVAKAGLENVLCQTLVEKELPCKHKITLPCFKNPEDRICKKKVHTDLPCGHTIALPCSTVTAGLANVYCMVKVPRIRRCGHKTTLPCHINPEKQYCDQLVELTLPCGHKKLTACSSVADELQAGICERSVTRKLNCGHEEEMQCSVKTDKIYCDAHCERFLPCGHPCLKKCGDDCSIFKCAVQVKKTLSCGYHKLSCSCSEDISQLICSNECNRPLKCGHVCPGKCFEDCSQYNCQEMVVKNLSCAGKHCQKISCSDDPNSVACQESCNRNLSCGHPCPGLCSQPCESMKCRQRVEKTFPCGHKQNLQCYQFKTASCKAPCRRRERCKHACKGVCGEPCSNYHCDVTVLNILPCGHRIKMPCGGSVDDVHCPAPCMVELPCGHQCSGTCYDCRQRGSHETCQHPCSRILVCSHRCQAICGEPCPPCIRNCGRRCPHEKCTETCFHQCSPCKRPCTWNCPHYQCNNLCGEECNRPRCDEPCPKKLTCNHPCTGLCGENCPTVCASCHAKKLSSLLGDRRATFTEATRYLQLFDCGHIVTVQEMDAWIVQVPRNDVQLIHCPRCSTVITFSYRYGNVIKRTMKNVENVKKKIRKLGIETARFAKCLLTQLRHPPEGIVTMAQKLWEHLNLVMSDNAHPRSIPLMFTLKNHCIILHQLEKAQDRLQNVTMLQASSKGQQDMGEHPETIKDALEKIKEYLEKPRLDLRTLDQVLEHTRKFALFTSILEAQSEAIGLCRSFSSIAETYLKMSSEGFELFLQGKNDTLQVDWMENVVASLRNEIGLVPLPPDQPKELENFPGFSKGVWKLCEHLEVYFIRWIVRDGEDIKEVSNGCRRCFGKENSD